MQSKTVIFDEDKISPESMQSFKEEILDKLIRQPFRKALAENRGRYISIGSSKCRLKYTPSSKARRTKIKRKKQKKYHS